MGSRHGIDGNWSTTELWVGSDASEAMNLLVSTSLSETWVVGSGGCLNRTWASIFPESSQRRIVNFMLGA